MTTSQPNTQRLPRPGDAEVPRPIRIDAAQRSAAVARLLGEADEARVEHFLGFARTNRICLDHLFALADRKGRVAHTVLAVPSPGRTAMFFASQPGRSRDVPDLAAVIDQAAEAMGEIDVHLAQTLLEPSETLAGEAFGRAGFRELARLSYLERPVPKTGEIDAPRWPADVTVEPYRDALDEQIVAVLDASYEQTMDCPGLRGLRRTEDILAGHRATGVFDPSLWTLLREKDQPAGVLLISPTPSQQSMELVYLGLAPPARGRSLGRLLLQHGLFSIAGRRERRISLAVDDRNIPAMRLYTAAGFRRALRRVAMIRSLHAP